MPSVHIKNRCKIGMFLRMEVLIYVVGDRNRTVGDKLLQKSCNTSENLYDSTITVVTVLT